MTTPGVMEAYRERGLGEIALRRLSRYAELLIASPVNVISAHSIDEIEARHFLDCLTLLDLPELHGSDVRIVDVGSGGGLPAVVLAVALPGASITAVESIGKKCAFIQRVIGALELSNIVVEAARAEAFSGAGWRERFDVAVARAVGPLHLVAELCVPLLRVGGVLVAMKGRMDETEWREGTEALGILGVDDVEQRPTAPFPEAQHRRLVVGRKARSTSLAFPRGGAAMKRPLGRRGAQIAIPSTHGEDP